MIIEIIYAVLIFYIAMVLGRRIFRIFKLKLQFNEELIFSIALGFAILGYIILVLGLLGFLYKNVFIALFFILVVVLIPEARLLKREFKKRKPKKTKKIKESRRKFNWLLVFVFLFLILNFIGALSPPTGWDTQIYHIPAQEQYFSQNKITYIPLSHADLPSLANMFILLGLIIKSDILAKLIFYSVFLVLVFAVHIFSKKYFSGKIASLSVLIFVALPQIVYYASTLHTDMFLTLFTFLSVISFFSWRKEKNDKWLFISAIFAGLALSTKITAVLMLAGFFILFFLLFLAKKDKKEILEKGFIFFLIVVMISSIWFIKAFVFTGNPVYPIAHNVFGGPQNLSYATEYTMKQLAESGYGKSFFAFILSPWHINANGYKFHSSFSLSPLFLVFIPLLLFLRKDLRENSLVKYLLLFSFIYYAIWFFMHPFLLKLIPILPLLSIITSFSIIKSFERKIIFKFIWIFVVFSFIFSLAMSGLIYQNQANVALGLESREDYLSRNLDIFDVFNYANNNLNNTDKILLIGEARNYYLDLEFQEGDPVRQGVLNYRIIDEKQLEKWLKEEEISYIIVNRNYFVNISDEKLNLYGYTSYSADLIENFMQNTELAYEKNNVFLYEIK